MICITFRQLNRLLFQIKIPNQKILPIFHLTMSLNLSDAPGHLPGQIFSTLASALDKTPGQLGPSAPHGFILCRARWSNSPPKRLQPVSIKAMYV